MIASQTTTEYVTADLDPQISQEGGYYICATAPQHIDIQLIVQGYDVQMS